MCRLSPEGTLVVREISETFAVSQSKGRVTLNGEEVWRPAVYRNVDAILRRQELIILGEFITD